MKARDVRPLLKEKGFEPGVISALEKLAEQQQVLIKQQLEMAAQHIKIIETMSNLTSVAEVMKKEVIEHQKRYQDDTPVSGN